MLLVVTLGLVLIANKVLESMASYIDFYNLGLVAVPSQSDAHHLPSRMPEWPCHSSGGPRGLPVSQAKLKNAMLLVIVSDYCLGSISHSPLSRYLVV